MPPYEAVMPPLVNYIQKKQERFILPETIQQQGKEKYRYGPQDSELS